MGCGRGLKAAGHHAACWKMDDAQDRGGAPERAGRSLDVMLMRTGRRRSGVVSGQPRLTSRWSVRRAWRKWDEKRVGFSVLQCFGHDDYPPRDVSGVQGCRRCCIRRDGRGTPCRASWIRGYQPDYHVSLRTPSTLSSKASFRSPQASVAWCDS